MNDRGMTGITERVDGAHRHPAAEAIPQQPDPFPRWLVRDLWAAATAGAAAGLLVGALLRRGVFVVPGWEQMYSAGDVTFHVLWVFIGVAAGVIAAAGLMSIRPAPRDGATGRPDAGGRQGDRISAATRADRMENHTPEG